MLTNLKKEWINTVKASTKIKKKKKKRESQIEVLEPKNVITKWKNSLEGMKNRPNEEEERISEFYLEKLLRESYNKDHNCKSCYCGDNKLSAFH